METLSGELSSHLTSVIVLTAVIAPLVLWRYRRAVLAGMLARPTAALPLPPAILPAPAAAVADADAAAAAAAAWQRRLMRRVFAAVLAAAFVAALPLSALQLQLNALPLSPAHLYLKAAVLALLAVPVTAVLCALPWRQAAALALAAVAALAAAGVLLSMLQRPFYGKAPGLDQARNALVYVQLAAFTLWLPALLGLACGARRVRGVAPLVLAGLLVFGLGPLLGLRLTRWLTGTQAGTEWVLSGPGLDAGFVLLALPIGALGWWRLKRLASAYRAKRFSDGQLLARTWWLLLVAIEALTTIGGHPRPAAIVGTLVASAASLLLFAPLLGRGLRWAHAHPGRPAPRTLLVLRVFGDTARSEALFDRIVARWHWIGPVTTIAAPDIVARTVDPGDFLAFVSGELAAEFVGTADDLDRRMASLDPRPDPDGRYRINECCCRDSSWQAAVVRLIEQADIVLMDLRGFGATRAGCAFELGELARRCRPAQVVLLVDASTDQALLGPMLGEGPAALPQVEMPRGASAQARAAMRALLRAG
jgi:hypothetical protein